MTEKFDSLDKRLRSAFSDSARGDELSGQLDIDTLRTRKARAYSPRLPGVIALAGGSVVTVAAVVVAGAGVLGPREPLFTLQASAAAAGMAASESMSVDARMMPWVQYRYFPSEDLSREAGRGSIYQLVLEGDPVETMRSIADALGVKGEPRESDYFDPAYPGYVIGDEQGLGELLSLWWTGSGSWYYWNPEAYPQPVCTDIADGDTVSTVCVEPDAPVEPLLSEEDARNRAAELFSATGLDVAADDIEVAWVDQWSINLSAPLRINGQPTAVEWYVSYGPGGEVASASGNSASVVERGQFDTVSPYEAVERVNEGIWWGGAAAEFFADMPVAAMARESDVGALEPRVEVDVDVDDGSAEDTGKPDAPESSDETPTVEDPTEPVESETPAEPEVPLEPELPSEPEVVDVEITESLEALLLVFDSEGGWWLVPGYVFTGSDGWPGAVISVVNGVLELPTTPPGNPEPAIEPAPLD